MGKASALKKRYIACKIKFKDKQSPSENEVKKGVYNEALKFFGEYLLSYVALKLVSYDATKKIAVLRCARDFYPETLGFLGMVNSLDGKNMRVVTVATSGTIKGLGKKLSGAS